MCSSQQRSEQGWSPDGGLAKPMLIKRNFIIQAHRAARDPNHNMSFLSETPSTLSALPPIIIHFPCLSPLSSEYLEGNVTKI